MLKFSVSSCQVPMSDPTQPLASTDLHRGADASAYGFETTADLQPLSAALGQTDALEALQFGLSIEAPGHNVFVLGAPGSGKATFVRQIVTQAARAHSTPPDWCYVFNFEEPRSPHALPLPPGRARSFQTDMHELVEDLRRSIPEALQSEEVAAQRERALKSRGDEASALMKELHDELVDNEHVALIGDKEARVLVPARGGEAIDEAHYEALPADARQTIDEHLAAAGKRVSAVQRQVHTLGRLAHEEVRRLHDRVVGTLVRHRIEALRQDYAELPDVVGYLGRVADDVVLHANRFLPGDNPLPEELAAVLRASPPEEFFRRYDVNALVCRDPDSGAPVVEAPDPNPKTLFGRTEGQLRLGIMVTDFTRIVPGATHRANGGFLILETRELLSSPFVWPLLKRTLRTRELRPADPASELGMSIADSLEPLPIPARMKVVLVGEPHLYYLLRNLDSEFAELFKVKVDFGPWMERSLDAERQYAGFIANQCETHDLPHFSAGAVARLVEEASRLAGDQTKLTTRFRKVTDLLHEATYHARAADRTTVAAEDVETALAARDRRNQLPHRELLDLIRRGTLAFHPVGEAVGQLFGIALIQPEDEPFGRPIRVMASAFLGTGGVVNIEREAELSGPIHNKGFLVLSGYLGDQFARHRPLILSASLSFDQLYEEVEGDSASVAELVALLSAIGEVPLKQGIALTGALNQDGLVLPVGGVTQKVEGFFDACRQVGLDGTQGVVLPRSNQQNLTLNAEVRAAVDEGLFRVWTVDRVEQVWPILADLPAGVEEEPGRFTEGSVHARVAARLGEWAEQWRAFGSGDAQTATGS